MSRQGIIDVVKRATCMVVQTGPFAGMQLHDRQTWGNGEDVGPQLLGVYESELHPLIEAAIAQRPGAVVNIGCAEGYYAVGLARRLPKAEIHAFDIDRHARAACRANATLNGVGKRVSISGPCSMTRLRQISHGNPGLFALVDCEGCENHLLMEPKVRLALRSATIIIEPHDAIDRQTTSRLIGAYADTHRPDLVRSGPRDPHRFAFLDRCADADKWLLVCENRPEIQQWLLLTPLFPALRAG